MFSDRRPFHLWLESFHRWNRSSSSLTLSVPPLLAYRAVPFELVIFSELKVVVPLLFTRFTPGLPVELTTFTAPLNVTVPGELVTERADAVAPPSLVMFVVPLTVIVPLALSIASPRPGGY